MSTILEVNQVEKTYGKADQEQTKALKGISFKVEEGEFIGIMGASGSGKSTLLNLLSTLDQPTAGSVAMKGCEISHLKGRALADFRAKEIGFIFQDFNLLETLTAAENIAIPLSLQGVKAKEIQARTQKIAKKLGIVAILNKYPNEISGGQKQRVAAARALITQPTLLLGDEPTGALDSKSAKDLLTLMRDLNEQDQVSILLVTHDPYSASYCQKILLIKDGLIHQTLERKGFSQNEFYQEILTSIGNLEK